MIKKYLDKDFTLRDFQDFMREFEKEKGFDTDTLRDKCILLGEEVGELFKAIRKDNLAVKTDKDSDKFDVASEISDIITVLMTVAIRLDVDIQNVVFEKMKKNVERVWE
jgi:NTP pyrophosphatase (non-canonical NTP hydrolase)